MKQADEKYAILLDRSRLIPYVDIADSVASILEMNRTDVLIRLRNQQGTLFQDINYESAVKIANFLIEKEISCGLVPMSQIFSLDEFVYIRNADIVEESIVLEDVLGKKTGIHSSLVELIMAGYILPKQSGLKQVSKSKVVVKRKGRGNRERELVMIPDDDPSDETFLLYLFTSMPEFQWIIFDARYFNYDYLENPGVSWKENLVRFMQDIASIIPEHRLDAGFKSIMANNLKVEKEYEYKEPRDMTERSRFLMTLMKTRGYI